MKDKTTKKLLSLKITEAIEKLSIQVNDLEEVTKPIAPENSIGRVSRMDAINNKGVNESALKVAKQKLIKLRLALEKIETEDFGICINCGSEIQEGRLMYMPESAHCIRCAGR